MSEFMEQPQVIGQPAAVLDRLSTVFHNAVDYIGDALPTPRVLAAGLSAGALALGLMPAGAEAKAAAIVPGQSVDGVTIGESQAQVEKKLGARPNPNQPSTNGATNLFYPSPFDGSVSLLESKVAGITTYSKHFKTSKGVGVGSSVAAVEKAYPEAKCKVGPTGPGSKECALDSVYVGQATVTTFVIQKQSQGVEEVDIDLKADIA
jgi:hypothetical protein